MSFRFRRTLSLLPGVRLNFGATGASVSVGPKGARLTVGPKGVRATAGIPGSGMFYSQNFSAKPTEQREVNPSPELDEVIRRRPPHWEFLLIQRALRSAVAEIDALAATALS